MDPLSDLNIDQWVNFKDEKEFLAWWDEKASRELEADRLEFEQDLGTLREDEFLAWWKETDPSQFQSWEYHREALQKANKARREAVLRLFIAFKRDYREWLAGRGVTDK